MTRKPPDVALSLQSLTLKRGERTILKDVTLALPPGRVYAVIGSNGAGKSSLLAAVLGLLPSTGEIRVFGRMPKGSEERALLTAYVPQTTALEVPFRAREVVAMGRFAFAANETRVMEALRQADALSLADRLFSTLSMGERQRVILARALASDAPLLLLDEPTSALDAAHALSTFRLLRSLTGERTVVMVVHSLDDASRFADEVLLLHDQGLSAHRPSDFWESARFTEAFGVALRREGLRAELPQ